MLLLVFYSVVCKLSLCTGKVATKDEEVDEGRLCFILSVARRGSEIGGAGSGVALLLLLLCNAFVLCIMFAVDN